jgi:crossover junction endodeoxyribonuclease RuvC
MRVLGIDPGIALTGYGIVESLGDRRVMLDFGCIRTPSSQESSGRLDHIYREIMLLAKRHKPDVMAVEKLFFNKNIISAMQVSEARGVAVLAGSHAGLPVFEYTPLQVKQAVAGYGRAEKAQVQQMVKILLSLSQTPKPDDAADALALALCHINTGRLQSIIERGVRDV